MTNNGSVNQANSVSLETILGEDEELTQGQKDAIEFVQSGKNVFITGGAGTGKSFIVKILKRLYDEEIKKGQFVVTSTTGSSAVDIGGRTIQNFAGFGIGETNKQPTPFDTIWKQYGKIPAVKLRWANLKILLIDEISILSTGYFRLLDQFARRMKMKETNEHSPHYVSPQCLPPFGGIQIIIMGDFFQLPPVGHEKKPLNDRFVFQTKEWAEAIGENVVCLTISKRCQDIEFTQMLDRIRWGKPTQDDIFFIGRRQMATPHPSLEPTMLYSKNEAVNEYNKAKIEELKKSSDCVSVYPKQAKRIDRGQIIAYRDTDESISVDLEESCKHRMESLIKDLNINVEAPLFITKKARVMLIVNLSTQKGLCNGSVGEVIGWAKVVNPPSTKLKTSKPKIVNREGSSFFYHNNKRYIGSQVQVSSNRLLTVEQFRHRGGQVEYLLPTDPIPKVESFSNTPTLKDDICPIVYFDSVDQIVVVGRYTWQGNDVVFLDENGNRISQKRLESSSSSTSSIRFKTIPIDVYVQQFPLQLCWALTTHKAQGMSLDPVHLDISNAFDGHLIYVALSRARNPNTLFISSIDYSKIRPDNEVVNFYSKYQSPPS